MCRLAASFGLFAALLLPIFNVSTAAVFTVNDTVDAVDANPGDGICATATGTCSLRAAITESNALGGGMVFVGVGHFLLTLGPLEVETNLMLSGAGAGETVIDGGGVDEVLVLQVPYTIEPIQISGVTVTNGRTGIEMSGKANCSISNSTVAGNSGNGITTELLNTLTITDSVIRDNGGVGVNGSGSPGIGSLVISRTTISGNGGGIIEDEGSVLISDSTISDNRSGTGTGGIELKTEWSAGVPLAAAQIGVAPSSGIINTTISGNYGIYGGGLRVSGFGAQGIRIDLPIVNTTITNNHASFGGGILIDSTVNCHEAPMGPRISNSIVAGNSATEQGSDCFTANNFPCGPGLPLGPLGLLPSDGYNLIGDATSCNFIATTGDQVGTASSPIDPHLGSLADNGGPTMTHALLPFISPAIDAGSPEVPGSSNTACQTTDQRGVARPQDGDLDGDAAICDIGAFELASRTDVAIEVEPFIPRDTIILSLPLPIPVVVLGSNTVDVTKIDLSTLRFGPNGATPVFTHTVPANGQVDLLAFFRVQDTGLAVADTQACLQGAISGQPFQGCDGVVVLMSKGCGLGMELAPILPALLWLRGRRRRRPV